MNNKKGWLKSILKEDEDYMNSIPRDKLSYELKEALEKMDEKFGIECIAAKIMAEESKKPIHLRNKTLLLSCPCAKCSNYYL